MTDTIIYAWREEQGDVWTGEWALDRSDKWVPAEANKYILIIPDASKPWVLAMSSGTVVRKSQGWATRMIGSGPTIPVRLALSCHCGDQTDNPADLARMRAVYAAEERMNG